MASVIPSAGGRALERASENFLQTLIRRAELEQQESQFSRRLAQEESQFATRAEQFESQLAQNDRIAALREIEYFQPFFIGKPVSEAPIMQHALDRLYPEHAGSFADPDDLGSLVLGDPTFEQYVNERRIETFSSLPSEEQQRLLEQNVVGSLTGTPRSVAQVGAEEDLFDIQWRAAKGIMNDPKVMDTMARNFLNQPETIDVTVGGRRFQWTSMDNAQIALGIMQLGMRSDAESNILAKQMDDLAGELVELAKAKGIGIHRGMARRIINELHSDPPEGMSRQQQVEALKQSLPATGQAALDMFIRGVNLASDIEVLLQTQMPQTWAYRGLAATFSQAGMSADMMDALLPRVARQMAQQGNINIMNPGRFINEPGNFWDVGSILPAPSDEERRIGAPSGSLSGPTVEAAREQMFKDAAAYAEGQITMDDLIRKYGQEGADVVAQAGSMMRVNQ